MSYVRFGDDSDVYVYQDIGGYLCCCGCALGDRYAYYSTDDLIAHLRKHVAAGHDVPDHVISALEADRVENDAWIEGFKDGVEASS